MTFTSNIPVTGDSLGGTRDRIRTNFQEIFSVNGVNHVNFNEAGEGKHKFLQMPQQASAPDTAADEGGFYTKNVSGAAQAFYRAESNGQEYQLTAVDDVNIGRFANNTVAYVANNNGGWTFLPGGMILQYGRRTSPGNSGAVTFPIPFPSGNAPFSIVVTNERDSARSANINNTGISSTGFSYFMETALGSIALNWVAIGN